MFSRTARNYLHVGLRGKWDNNLPAETFRVRFGDQQVVLLGRLQWELKRATQYGRYSHGR